jgi:prepilin peptidase dependent protein B
MPALERGFTLPEVMLALTFGSLIALAAAKTYPVLRQHSVDGSALSAGIGAATVSLWH